MDYLYFDTIVIGSGAAGYNAAGEIRKGCNKSVCIITEGKNLGTSRNTGSDKQTYYKLTLAGSEGDSVISMAEDLFRGGAVDGDTALCEAASSSQCFFNLCSLGVPFPHNRYGEYTGYKTDHDPHMRATSAGPLTSKFMTEALEKQAERLGIQVLDGLLAIEILKDGSEVTGLVCLDIKSGEFRCFCCNNIVLATGGPAGVYKSTVYPVGHTGSTGLAISAGAALQNMTEWQYGLSTVSPRWNVSGTYMQVLPRFISIDENNCEHEFLGEYFEDIYEALSLTFLKGYQWPFDSAKAKEGSSQLDLAVYNECVNKNRRVYLDFTKNPFGLDKIDFSRLWPEAYEYLLKADALFGTPIERLRKMNAPAIELYRSKGVDISREYIEISLCAQHNNGGVAVDIWWQSTVKGLFAAGECAGTHGITRPGGSALNAGQAGSMRAAKYIAAKEEKQQSTEKFTAAAREAVKRHEALRAAAKNGSEDIDTELQKIREEMSRCAAAVRIPEEISLLCKKRLNSIKSFPEGLRADSPASLVTMYKYYDALITQCAVLLAMKEYYDTVGINRGSAVYIPEKNQSDAPNKDMIQEISLSSDGFRITRRSVRPIPEKDDFFENIWRSYRENKNIY